MTLKMTLQNQSQESVPESRISLQWTEVKIAKRRGEHLKYLPSQDQSIRGSKITNVIDKFEKEVACKALASYLSSININKRFAKRTVYEEKELSIKTIT